MKKWLVIIAIVIAIPILAILGLLFFHKPYIPLKVDNNVVAVVRQPLFGPVFGESSTDVYAGREKIFSLYEDFFDEPAFIYPFRDGKRFLCDYSGDTATWDFVVDVGTTNVSGASRWPLDKQLGASMTDAATNIVHDAKGIVRLPNEQELQEVVAYLTSTTPGTIKAGYLDVFNFDTKRRLLLDLATNRESFDP
jgi:hypothetical protein